MANKNAPPVKGGALGKSPGLGDPWGEEKIRADFEEFKQIPNIL